jgi:uncharacterized damage-inducible protein DinB
MRDIGHAGPSEFAPYAAAYVALVEGADVIETLSAQFESTEHLIAEFERRSAHAYAYGPGKWTVADVLCHISDTERIFSYRTLCVARGEAGALPGFDQESYARVSGANERSLADLLSEFRVVRFSTLALLTGLPREAWSRRGDVNGYSVTVRGLAFHIAGHELHHVKILRDRYLPRLQ